MGTLPHAACCGDLLLCLHASSCLPDQCNCLQSLRDEDLADALLWHLSQSDHMGGECYSGLHLRLPTAWDARLPGLGKHHRLQHYSPHPVKSEYCCLSTFAYFCKYFQSGQHYRLQMRCLAAKATPTEIFSFS